jgi:hypothetical protein
MDPQEYRDARWHALLRAAEDLGVETEQAPALVDAVLARQHRRIRRAEDPDPLVRQALTDAVLGVPARPRGRRWPAVAALALLLGAVGAVVALTRPDPPPTDHLRADQVPSLFGYDADAAQALLEKRGLRVTLRPFRSCEVLDRVVGSQPAPGTTYDRGDRVVVFTAVPADITCLTDYQDRQVAWQLLDFANGRGAAPAFAPRVRVYPGDGRPEVLTAAQAADPASWRTTGILAAVHAVSRGVALVTEHPLTYDVPTIRLVPASSGLGQCGVPDPSAAGTADVVAVIVRPADRSGCPVRVELYRDADRRIEGVAFYPASS